MNNKVKFLRGTSNEYTVAEKDSDTIYFTTDDGKLYIGDKEISGSDITIDDTLSDTSTNPVQNKVVKQAIDNKADKIVATTSADGLMSAEDKSKLDSVDDTYALKSKYGDTTINVGRKAGTAGGIRSTAEGYNTTASGDYSHAEGASTTASGNRSHAEGYLCTASSGNSHAEGNNTTASGAHSHSEGDNTIASGIGSHAGGASSIASSDYSFAHGMHVESNNSCEVSLGKFNKSSSDTLFSIGDGKGNNGKHNAFEITTTGGKLHDKDIATTDKIPDLSPYAKKTDVPNIKVNSAVNADTAWLIKPTLIGTAEHCTYHTILDWANNVNGMGQAVIVSGSGYPLDIPVDDEGMVTVETDNENMRKVVTFKPYGVERGTYRRNIWNGGWRWDWVDLFSEKPYVTGSATVAANSTTCTSNHGFTPSAVIWWDGNSSGVATSFSGTQFTIDKTSSVGRTINYLIFK